MAPVAFGQTRQTFVPRRTLEASLRVCGVRGEEKQRLAAEAMSTTQTSSTLAG